LGTIREGKHLPPLTFVAILDANRCRYEGLACLGRALFRCAVKRACGENVCGHSVFPFFSPATAIKAASARPSSLMRAE
jgi:hypothetical protein